VVSYADGDFCEHKKLGPYGKSPRVKSPAVQLGTGGSLGGHHLFPIHRSIFIVKHSGIFGASVIRNLCLDNSRAI
jgi:hypothetical protein